MDLVRGFICGVIVNTFLPAWLTIPLVLVSVAAYLAAGHVAWRMPERLEWLFAWVRFGSQRAPVEADTASPFHFVPVTPAPPPNQSSFF